MLKAAASPPPAEALSNAETTRAAFGGDLGSVLTAFDQTFTALDGVGPAPSSGGDKVVVEARATLVTLRTTVAEIKGKEDARPGPAVGGDTVTNLVAALRKRLMLEDPSLNLSAAGPELGNEVKTAPSCQETSSYSRRSLLDAQGGYNTNPYTNPVPVPIPSFERLTAVPAPSSKPR